MSPEEAGLLERLDGPAQDTRRRRIQACGHIVQLTREQSEANLDDWMARMADYICQGSIDWRAPQPQIAAEVAEVFRLLATVFEDPPGSRAPTTAQIGRIGDRLAQQIEELPSAVRNGAWPHSLWREHVVETIMRSASREYHLANRTRRGGPQHGEARGHWLRLVYLVCRYELCRTTGAWPPLVPAPQGIMAALQAADTRVLASRGRRDRQDRPGASRG